MPAPAMRYLRRLNEPAVMDRGDDPARLRQLLLDSSCIFMLLGTCILMQQLTTTGTAASSNAEHVFIAFMLWLFGTAFGMLSLVTRQFPRLAVAAAAAVRVLRKYLIGGLKHP